MQGASISLALGKSNLWLSGKGTAFISHALPLSSGAPVMADKVRLVNRQGLCAHLLLRCAVETAGVWAQCFLPPSPASELQLHGLKLPFETLKGPASWGHLCMLQQCLCGSWLALVPGSFKKKKKVLCSLFSGVSAQIQPLLALVQVWSFTSPSSCSESSMGAPVCFWHG